MVFSGFFILKKGEIMKIINLTKKAYKLPSGETFLPSGKIAVLQDKGYNQIGTMGIYNGKFNCEKPYNNCPLEKTVPLLRREKLVNNLPEEKDDVTLIVDEEILTHAKATDLFRSDLISPMMSGPMFFSLGYCQGVSHYAIPGFLW